MSEEGPSDNKSRPVAEAAERILDAYGHVETSDSSRVVYTDGDLNIGRESGTLKIIFRGTLVFRHGPGLGPDEQVFEGHGDWARLVQRIAANVSGPPGRAA
jgi:hypothetical protein